MEKLGDDTLSLTLPQIEQATLTNEEYNYSEIHSSAVLP